MAEYVTNGNLRTRVYDPDEPIEGYKKKTWKAPAEWGEGRVMCEGHTSPKNRDRLSGEAVTAGLFALTCESLYFEKVDKWVHRLLRPVHGYDHATIHQHPASNDDDLCAVPA